MTVDMDSAPAPAPAAAAAPAPANGVNGAGAHAKPATESIADGAGEPPAYQAHPLGPLSAQEITESSGLIRAAWPQGTVFQFKVVTLLEPAKAQLMPYLEAERKGQTPTDIDRRSFVVYYLRNTVSGGGGHDS